MVSNPEMQGKMMWNPLQYELLDFGQGRKLESFSGFVVDRPCPAAESATRASPELWNLATLHFAPTLSPSPAFPPNTLQFEVSPKGTPQVGESWVGDPAPQPWLVEHESIVWQLKPTPFGHVGLFPEQVLHWPWLTGVGDPAQLPSRRVLHLFAYTGGTTLHLARLGWQVVHVDSSKPAVQWARQNANASGLEGLPIRWIVEDAVLFVERELRRGNRYELIVLDPPAFGHGPKGQRWELSYQIEDLLTDCCQLLSDHAVGVLLTGHSDDEAPERWMWRALERANQDQWTDRLEYGRSELVDRDGRALDFGYSIRWSAKSPVL